MKDSSQKRILLGQLGLNGDCLIVTVIARQIKQDYPRCHLTWAISSFCKSTIEENPYVDQIWEIPASNWNEIVLVGWPQFEQEARRRFASGEFDEIFFTQVYPRNGQNYDGTTRVSHFRGYPGNITVPLQNIIRLRYEEVQRVRQFAEQNHLADYRNVILFECKSSSNQSFVTPEYALHVSHRIMNIIPECAIVLSSNMKIVSQDHRIIDGSILTLRENAELTKYCTLFIGCSSGITQIALTDWAKPLPMIQLLSGATSVYASVVHDLEYWKQPTFNILEMTDTPPEKLTECVIVAFTKGFSEARLCFHQQISLNFAFYLYHVRAFILPTGYIKAAQALLHTVRRYGLHPQLKTFIENEFIPKIALQSAIIPDDQACIKLLEGFLRSHGHEPALTNLYIQQDSHKENPIVSICIPVYNGENFLAEALSSAIAQTYPYIEIIVSDDDSNDKTVEIAKSFQKKSHFDFLIILRQNKSGQNQNLNFCISQAKGKYIKFLFHDDLLEPTCIEEMVKLAEQDDDIGLVFSPRELLIVDDGTERSKANYDGTRDIHKYWSELSSVQSGQKLLNDPDLFNYNINKIGEPSTVLISKKVFETVGQFDTELRQIVDIEMWLRIMTQFKIGFVNKVLSYFRIHSSQLTNEHIKKNLIQKDFLMFFRKIYINEYYPDKVRTEAFQRFKAIYNQNPELGKKIYPKQKIEIKQQSDINLRNERKHLAESWLKVPPEFLEKAYLGDMGNTHRRLMESSIRNEALSNEETAFFQQLNSELMRRSSVDPVSALNYLLAIMLYLPSGRLKIENARASLPGWLIGDYEKFFGV